MFRPTIRKTRGGRLTAAGHEFLLEHSTVTDPPEVQEDEEVTTASGVEVSVPHIVVQAAAFESYMLDFMKVLYPSYSWYHQGRHKNHERGLDLIGTRLRRAVGRSRVIGVQVKLHQSDTAPSDKEWLKFLAGCFVRKVDEAVFVTTGRLTSEQRREAAEAQVVVIEGRAELDRLAKKFNIDPY